MGGWAMSKVIVDDELRAKLNGLDSDTEFCDPDGKPLGFFVAAEDYKKMVYAWLDAQVSDEDLERASQETGGRPLAEIWKDLERS
jgi:hypothetical protein